MSFTGAHTDFDGLDANPRPVGTVPIVVGGRTRGAYRRAVEQGHGWYGFALTPVEPLTADTTAAFADAGTDRVIVFPIPVEDEATIDTYLARHAEFVLV